MPSKKHLYVIINKYSSKQMTSHVQISVIAQIPMLGSGKLSSAQVSQKSNNYNNALTKIVIIFILT